MNTTTESILDAVRQARSDGASLRLRGGDTKHQLGGRSTGEVDLRMTGLNGLVSYEPGELVLVAQPGMPLAAVEALLAAENQHLPFEPPHWGADATLGGTIACNLSGPRRFRAGALRDFLLGLQMVDGHGQLIRAGGRVVKNVTGYDLCKLLSGSFGTLGPLTEVCLKVWPRPECQQTLVWHGLEYGDAVERMLDLAASPFEVTGLTYGRWAQDEGSARTCARLEGPGPAVAAQAEAIAGRYGGEVEHLAETESASLWEDVREARSLRPRRAQQLWRISCPAVNAGALVGELRSRQLQEFALDWGGALIWALFPRNLPGADLHGVVSRHQGIAWRLATGPDDDNRQAFSPLEPGVARLNAAVKQAFDPLGLFNPNRLPIT